MSNATREFLGNQHLIREKERADGFELSPPSLAGTALYQEPSPGAF